MSQAKPETGRQRSASQARVFSQADAALGLGTRGKGNDHFGVCRMDTQPLTATVSAPSASTAGQELNGRQTGCTKLLSLHTTSSQRCMRGQDHWLSSQDHRSSVQSLLPEDPSPCPTGEKELSHSSILWPLPSNYVIHGSRKQSNAEAKRHPKYYLTNTSEPKQAGKGPAKWEQENFVSSQCRAL